MHGNKVYAVNDNRISHSKAASVEAPTPTYAGRLALCKESEESSATKCSPLWENGQLNTHIINRFDVLQD